MTLRAANACPECEALLTPVENCGPSAGDFAPCPRCDAVNVFRDDLSLRPAEPHERALFARLTGR